MNYAAYSDNVWRIRLNVELPGCACSHCVQVDDTTWRMPALIETRGAHICLWCAMEQAKALGEGDVWKSHELA